MRIFFVAIIFLTIITSCRKEVDGLFVDSKHQLGLNCIASIDTNNNTSIEALVFISDDVNGNKPIERISMADVVLTSAGSTYAILKFDTNSQTYKTDITLIPDREYTCNVKYDTFPELTATTFLPKIIIPTIVSSERVAFYDEYGSSVSSLTIAFENDKTKECFYELRFFTVYPNYPDTNTHSSYESYPYKIIDTTILREGLPIYLFSNRNIKSDSCTISLLTYASDYFEFRSVSEDYYKYRRSVYFYEAGRYPDLFEPVAPPTQLYSNVKNGYGTFVAYSYYCKLLFK